MPIMIRPCGIPLLVLLIALCGVGPVRADIPVQHRRGVTPLGAVRRIASECGATGWDAPGSDGRTVHVLLALRRRDAGLFVSLPKQISDRDAANTLRRLATALHWPDPELDLDRRPYGTFGAVITNGGAHTPTRTKSVIDLDLAAVRRELSGSGKPRLLFCVRAMGAVVEVQPDPAQRTTESGESFLFFGDTAEAIHLMYGIPQRWLAAALASLLVWLFLPILLAFAAATYQRSRGMSPADYLAPFQRWNSAIRCLGFLVAVVTVAALIPGVAPLAYLGRGWRLFSRLLWMMPLPYWFLQGLLIQLVWPWLTRREIQQRVSNPWGTATDAAVFVAVSAAFAGPFWLAQTGGPGAVLANAPRWMGASSILGSLPFFAFALRAKLQKRPKLFHTEVPKKLPSGDPELAAEIQELAERISVEPAEDRPEVARAAPLLRAIYHGIRALEPLDQAALRISTQLAIQAARPLVQVTASFIWVMPGTLFLPGLWLLLWPPASYQLAVSLMLGLLFGELLLQRLAWRVIRARRLDYEAAADRTVAAALGDRERLLRSLRAVQDRLREAEVPSAWLSLEKRIARLVSVK